MLNGAVARADFDVFSAGTYYKATTLTLPATAAGGAGVSLELVNKTSNPALVCAIELTTANPAGIAAPTADVELSLDGGATWSTVGAAVAMDPLGRGSLTFTPEIASDSALVRVFARDGARPADASAVTTVPSQTSADRLMTADGWTSHVRGNPAAVALHAEEGVQYDRGRVQLQRALSRHPQP